MNACYTPSDFILSAFLLFFSTYHHIADNFKIMIYQHWTESGRWDSQNHVVTSRYFHVTYLLLSDPFNSQTYRLAPIIGGDGLTYTFIWRETKAAKEVKCCPVYLLQFLKTTECVEASKNEERNPSKWFIKRGWSLPGFQWCLIGLQRRGSKSISSVSLNYMTAVWWRRYLTYLGTPQVFTMLVAQDCSWLSWTFLFCSLASSVCSMYPPLG